MRNGKQRRIFRLRQTGEQLILGHRSASLKIIKFKREAYGIVLKNAKKISMPDLHIAVNTILSCTAPKS